MIACSSVWIPSTAVFRAKASAENILHSPGKDRLMLMSPSTTPTPTSLPSFDPSVKICLWFVYRSDSNCFSRGRTISLLVPAWVVFSSVSSVCGALLCHFLSAVRSKTHTSGILEPVSSSNRVAARLTTGRQYVLLSFSTRRAES
uniref:(northern house mosquito) hypothetical protein n=1 Tax=Culex pipiens TaxID=7175 RepID=A0A8D8B2M2_CULPI